MIFYIIIGAVFLMFGLFGLAACVAASRADDQSEALYNSLTQAEPEAPADAAPEIQPRGHMHPSVIRYLGSRS